MRAILYHANRSFDKFKELPQIAGAPEILQIGNKFYVAYRALYSYADYGPLDDPNTEALIDQKDQTLNGPNNEYYLQISPDLIWKMNE